LSLNPRKSNIDGISLNSEESCVRIIVRKIKNPIRVIRGLFDPVPSATPSSKTIHHRSKDPSIIVRMEAHDIFEGYFRQPKVIGLRHYGSELDEILSDR